MYRVILFISIHLLVLNGYSASIGEQAQKSYRDGNYTEAIDKWQKEVQSLNCRKPQAYFNLGNAQFKNKSYGQALANYEKSLREDYNQEDIKFNIKVTRAKLGLDTDNKVLFLTDFIKKAAYLFSENTLKIILIILGLILFGLGVFSYFQSFSIYDKAKHYLFTLGIILTGLFFLQRHYKTESGSGIIGIDSIGYESMNMKGESKTLREGEKVEILDAIGENVQVETEANKKYWIEKSSIIPI